MYHTAERYHGVRMAAGILAWLMILFGVWSCSDTGAAKVDGAESSKRPDLIADAAAFDHLLAASGDRLIVIDFFADWCAPCKLLEPILAEVAGEVENLADLYAVDVDANRPLAQRMGVSGIPNVLLIRNGKTIDRLRGVLPKETYLAAIHSATR